MITVIITLAVVVIVLFLAGVAANIVIHWDRSGD